MNSFQQALSLALAADSEQLEIVAREQNKVTAIYNGVIYSDYSELPKKARFALAKSISPYLREYDELARRYGALDAEERMVWCLFGSLDSAVDIDVSSGNAHVEVSSHCSSCQYEHPFCRRMLPHLTHRQQECFMLMRQGKTDKEIAQTLGISYYTVIRHINNAVSIIRDLTNTNITRQYIVTQLMEAGI